MIKKRIKNIQLILIILICACTFDMFAQTSGFYISKVLFDKKKLVDEFTNEQLKKIQGPYNSDEELRLYINEALLDTGLRNISYEKRSGGLYLEFDLLPRVKNVRIKGKVPASINISPYIIKKGSYIEEKTTQNSLKDIERVFRQHGYNKAHINIENDNNSIIYTIDHNKPLLVEKINIVGGDHFLQKEYRKLLNDFYKKVLNRSTINREKENLDIKMREFGYLSLHTKIHISGQSLTLKINFHGPYIFNFEGNEYFNNYELKKRICSELQVVDTKTSEALVSSLVEVIYKKAGFYSVNLKVKTQNYKENNLGQIHKRFDIKVEEGPRESFKKVVFRGNQGISLKKLRKHYSKNASSLLLGHYIDEEGSQKLVDEFRKLYVENGYLSFSSKVKIPYISNEKEESFHNIDFIFNEGNQTVVSDVRVIDINGEIIDNLLTEKFRSKYLEKPINPFLIEEDIEEFENDIKAKGFLNAKVVNKNQRNLIKYSKDKSTAKLTIVLERAQRQKIGKVYVFGNFKTKDKLILKHINFSKYDYITPKNLDKLKKSLFALGLFQSVGVEVKASTQTPLGEGDVQISDIIIRVKERDYGQIEVIPGLRSDTGAKIGFNVGYSNLGGMARSLRWTSEISQRLTYSVFDEARRAQDNKFLEYALNLSFTEVDFLKKNINYLVQAGLRRRRFFAFDARVSRFANTLSYSFPDINLNFSLGHQYEAITQENGSNASDNGEFKIGSIIPKLSYDWRDNLSNPRSGALHQLDIEWADRLWFSQDVDGQNVSFTKFVLRNKFYVPFNGGTVAFGWTAGVQQNSANSSVPGIKIFRLTGIDQVRGFSEDEINRLSSGDDISQSSLTNNAFLNSVKVEPRFFIGKNLMLGAFWDAGRVTLDESRFFDLKQSVGLSLRILTPVGSINLDYGQKLSPEEFADGSIESSGRFHLSIGLF